METGRKRPGDEGLRGVGGGGPKRGFGNQEVEVFCCSREEVHKLRHQAG